MKSFIILALLIVAVAVSGVAQEVAKHPTIQVTGTADIMVAPDEVIFSLDVTKRNKDMQIAKKEADEALAKIIELTRRYSIKPEDVRTDYISVEMKYQSIRDPNNRIFDEDGDEIGTRVFLGYDVSTTVIVRLKKLERFEEFFGEVLRTGLSEIDSVRFESSKMIEERKMAREQAMKAAYEKASAMAAAIGQTIGKAFFIAEGTPQNLSLSGVNSNSNSINFRSGPVTVSESVATFSPGAIKISSQVTITFLLN